MAEELLQDVERIKAQQDLQDVSNMLNDASQKMFDISESLNKRIDYGEPVEVEQPTPEPKQDARRSVTFSELDFILPKNNFHITEYDYVSTFLLFNQGVRFFTVDLLSRSISVDVEPEALHPTVIEMPSNTGDATNTLIEALSTAPAGSTIKGKGEYRIRPITIVKAIRFDGITFKPYNEQQEHLLEVRTSDFQMFRCLLDTEGHDVVFHINMETGSNRPVIVDNVFKGLTYAGGQTWANACNIQMRGHTDAHIAGNIFEDTIGTASFRSLGGVRCLMINGRGRESVSGGMFINNTITNVQSQGGWHDADVVAIQALPNDLVSGRPFLVAGNNGVDAGGRLVKLQAGNAHVGSNVYEWQSKSGSVGSRFLKSAVSVQNSSNCTVRNNAFKNADAGYAIEGLVSILSNISIPDNVQIDHNILTWDYSGLANANDFIIQLTSGSGAAPNREATNSHFADNTISGQGYVDTILAFYEGWRPSSGFNYDNNNISLNNGSLVSDPR